MSMNLLKKNKSQPHPQAIKLSLRMVVLVLVMLTMTGIFYAYASVESLNIGYETSAALNLQREMMETNRRLKLELSNLRSPYSLERRAGDMGLVKPSQQQIRRIQ
jgi:hypothetical protein